MPIAINEPRSVPIIYVKNSLIELNTPYVLGNISCIIFIIVSAFNNLYKYKAFFEIAKLLSIKIRNYAIY